MATFAVPVTRVKTDISAGLIQSAFTSHFRPDTLDGRGACAAVQRLAATGPSTS